MATVEAEDREAWAVEGLQPFLRDPRKGREHLHNTYGHERYRAELEDAAAARIDELEALVADLQRQLELNLSPYRREAA